MNDLKAYFANCTCDGEEFTTHNNERVRDLIRLTLDGFDIELRQRREVILGPRNMLDGRWVPTTEVVVRRVPERRLGFVRELLGDLADVLAFATTSRVEFYSFEYPLGSGRSRRWTTGGEFHSTWPIVERIVGASTSHLIESIWHPYRSLKKTRRLNVVIHYIVEAQRQEQSIELSLVVGTLILESLKDSYARAVGIPFRRGHFFHSGPGTKSPTSARTYTFEELLQEMLRASGVRRGTKRIVRLRNELIHQGICRLPFKSAWAMYMRIMQLAREYLLRLLGYRGRYCAYGGTIRTL